MNPFSVFLQSRYNFALSRQKIDRLQQKGFAHLRRNIMRKSPFYAAFADRPFAEWPVMTKARMMEEFTAINTAGLERDHALQVALQAETSRDFSPMIGKIALGLSTGTSGQRGIFATNRRERGLWAALMLGRFIPSMLGRQRVAFFLRANNRLYESLSNPLIEFRFYDLLTPFETHLETVEQQDPTVLIAPAQILGLLAQAQLAGKVTLHPDVVISVAEVASPEDAALIRRAFGKPLDQVYQCTEGVLGMTCLSGNLHLNESHLHIEREVIDPVSGAFVPIITDLARETQPIIRYRLDDVLIPDPEPCPCGCMRQRLLRIEGRCDDILYWRAQQGGLRMIPSDAIRQAIANAPVPIRDYRAAQYGPDRLCLTLDSDDPDAERAVSAGIATQAQALGARPPQLEFSRGLPLHPDRKRRRIVNHQPLPHKTEVTQ